VVKKFEAEGYNPEGYTLFTYATLQVYAAAAKKAGSTEPDEVAKALRDGSYDTVLGPLSFNEKGDITDPKYVMYKWSNGKYAEVGS
jgi:branched-chain amino acid transport system substrate-binding protein